MPSKFLSRPGPLAGLWPRVSALYDPIDLTQYPLPVRKLVHFSAVLLIIAMLFLVRPIEWQQFGGIQVVADGLSLPIATIIIFASLLGMSSAVATWACLTADHAFIRFMSLISIVPVLALTNTSYERVLLSITNPARSTQDFDILFVLASMPLITLNIVGLVLPFILVGAVAACLLPSELRLQHNVAIMWAFFAASIPIIKYLYVLLFAETTFRIDSGDTQSTLRALVADSILSSMLIAIQLLAQWANTSAAILIREAGQFARVIAKRVNSRTMVLCLALGKITYATLGFRGTLPSPLGGTSPLWSQVTPSGTWLSWLVAIAVAIAVVAMCASARSLKERSVPLEGWIVLFAILISFRTIMEILLRIVDGAFPIIPLPDGDPLYLGNSTGAALELVVAASIAICIRRRNPHAAVLFVVGIVVALPRAIEVIFAFNTGVVNFLMLDLLASVFAGVAMLVPALAKLRLSILVYLIGSTVMILAHISIVEMPALGVFGWGLGGSMLWYTYVKGGDLKLLSAYDKSVLVLILASTALFTVILWSSHMVSGYVGWDVESLLETQFRAALTSVGVPALLVISATHIRL